MCYDITKQQIKIFMKNNFLLIIFILILGIGIGFYYNKSKQPVLSQEIAESLVKQTWGGCTEDMCGELKVSILDEKDGVWFVQAIYDSVRDDSVRAVRKIAEVYYADNAWKVGTVITDDFRCQPNRGHQDFGPELCI